MQKSNIFLVVDVRQDKALGEKVQHVDSVRGLVRGHLGDVADAVDDGLRVAVPGAAIHLAVALDHLRRFYHAASHK